MNHIAGLDYSTMELPILEAAAQHRVAEAQYHLGKRFECPTDGTPPDYKQAALWYGAAVDQNHPAAQNDLGNLYMQGCGVLQDNAEATRLFRESAFAGYVPAQLNLGRAFLRDGSSVDINEEGIYWVRKAAYNGLVKAQVSLGRCYENGTGVRQSDHEAARWYLAAAKQGDGEAKFHLGEFCDEGKGGLPQDDAELVHWIYESAQSGFAPAQECLSLCYADGSYGLRQSETEAVFWAGKAAEQGLASSQRILGDFYIKGFGVSQNIARGIELISEAAAQNEVEAQEYLGLLFSLDDTVEQDLEIAVPYLLKASQSGSKPALRMLFTLAAELSERAEDDLNDPDPEIFADLLGWTPRRISSEKLTTFEITGA